MAEKRLEQLGIKLPAAPEPVASYVPAAITGNLIYVSGQIPIREKKLVYEGIVGKDVSLEQAQEAAKICIINVLAVVKKELRTLDRIKKIVRLSGYVASTPDFTQQPAVINGASDLLVQVFGDTIGKHSRIAIGVASLPLNAPVEIDLIAEIGEDL
ncbi:MAG: RidA family protein [Deltaproteobacteria bacterium]|nr:MAG: RidA family protein [Deltaproteobacteria bacterium]HEC31603.1 RidA family protein [Deltaproteobacteria bacterium]